MLPPDPKKLLPSRGAADTTPDHSGSPLAPAPVDITMVAPPPPPAALSAPPGLNTLVQAFARCWKLALFVALFGGTAAGAIAWFALPAQYTSQILFKLSARPSRGSLEGETEFASVQKAQMALVKSHEVLGEAITRSRVVETHGVNSSLLAMQKKMQIDFTQGGPEVMRILLTDENPEAVAAILNSIGETYPAKIQQADDARVRERIATLRKRLAVRERRDNDLPRSLTLAEQLRDKRAELRDREAREKIDDPETLKRKFDNALNQLGDVRRSLRELRQRRSGLEAVLKVRKDRLKDVGEPRVSESEIDEALRATDSYKQMQEAIEAINADIEGYYKKYQRAEAQRLAREPQDRKRLLQGRIDKLRAAARERVAEHKREKALEEARKDVADYSEQVDRADQEEKKLLDELTRLQIEVENYRLGGPKASPEVENLRDEVKQLEKETQLIGDEVATLEGSLPIPSRVVRMTEALVPTERDMTRQLKFSGAAFLGVFGVLLGTVCFFETRSRRIYGASDVSQGLGMPLVGTLPLLPVKARKTAGEATVALDGRAGLTEAVDAIRTVLLHSPRLDGARVVMVTSAVSGEGKTTLASHLAASLARAWRKTLLIDCDLRNPAVHTQFNLPVEPGFCEALRGEIEFEDAIRETPVSRLWTLPAGKCDPFALEALAQDQLAAVFEKLEEQYDFIVIDTSPVLPVPDALVVGKHADAVILSILREVSRMPAVYAAQQRLQALGIRTLGAVVIGEKEEAYGQVGYPRTKK